MLGARALRNTARRVKERKFGKAWGPGSGVNDASKLLSSLVLFVGSTAAGRLLPHVMPDDVDEMLLWIIHAVASVATCRVVFFVVRRPTMRLLLRVQPWARSNSQDSPLCIAIWEVALALLQPGNASTAFFEGVLPPLPRCGTDCALQRHLQALEPVASAAAHEAANEAARQLLRVRAELEQDLSRCTQEDGSGDWAWACTWKQPLQYRDAHVLARCFYLLDRQALPEGVQGKQMMRAAVLTMRLLDFMKRVGHSTIPCRGLMSRAQPVPKIVPRCVQAFDTLFATSIEPESTGVKLRRRDLQACSHHIVVLCHGQAVEVPVRDVSGTRVSESQLMKLLVKAEASAKAKAMQKGMDPFAVDTLSWLPWSEWGQAISQFTIGSTVNDEGHRQDGAQAAEKMWSAALVLALDAKLPSWPQALDAYSNRALGLILGPSPACRGGGRWRDGSFCLVVQPDGYAGLCCSLPLAEPWATAQMWEFALSKERYPISAADVEVEVAKPKCICTQSAGTSTTAALRSQLEQAQTAFSSAARCLSLRVVHIKSIGWRVLTRLKVAPAALIHLAAHVAMYRVQGAIAFSNMALDVVPTPLFVGGRCDWVCTTSELVVEFVKIFCKSQSTPAGQDRATKRRLLLEACTFLDKLRRETSLGKGFLRFLLALHGSSASSRRRSTIEALLPSQPEQAQFPAIGLSTWLCEVQSDPKTPQAALSLGGGGGFCMASGKGCCRVSVAPVGDIELVLHVSCFHTPVDSRDAAAAISQLSSRDTAAALAEGDQEFVDCVEASGSSTDLKQEAQKLGGGAIQRSDCSSLSSGVEISADAVAQETERALLDMVHLLQVT